MKKVDSNKLNSQIDFLCRDCGTEALKLPENKSKKQFEVSSWYTGICDACGGKRAVTQARDFMYPVVIITKKEKRNA